MKLVGLFDSPYVRRVAVTMRWYGIPFGHCALSVFRNQDEIPKLDALSAYCESLPAFKQPPLE